MDEIDNRAKKQRKYVPQSADRNLIMTPAPLQRYKEAAREIF
jgi:hypothetical protein